MGKILSVTPYKYCPPENGGHHGIILVDRLLHLHNTVRSLSTLSNSGTLEGIEQAFIMPDSVKRYIPFYLTSMIDNQVKTLSASHLFIHHHYIFPTAYNAAQRHKIPLYIRSHNIESMRFKSLGKKWWRIMWWFEKYAYHKADKVFFVTEEDKLWAEKHYQLPTDKGVVMPFGIQCTQSPVFNKTTKNKLAQELKLRVDVPWIFFMGKLDYAPNAQAVQDIIHNIYPELLKKNQAFELLIFGKGIDENASNTIQELNSTYQNIHYLGFVPVIEDLLLSCQVMLNPVNSGGGVKTKVVEAIAWNNVVVSSKTGAIGVEKRYCGDLLQTVNDEHWSAYADRTIELCNKNHVTPEVFYDYYSLGKIAARVQKYF